MSIQEIEMTTPHPDADPAASEAPFYKAVGDEVDVFRAAARRGLPVLLKGPTGCGKTRFVEAMAHELGRDLITVAGHEDMTSADLVGRFLLKGGETVWVDGPLTRAWRKSFAWPGSRSSGPRRARARRTSRAT